MQYEPLIREAWRLTMRFRSLWILGLFAGGAAPSCSLTNRFEAPRTTPTTTSPQAEQFMRAVADWVAANIGLLVVIMFGLAVLLVGEPRGTPERGVIAVVLGLVGAIVAIVVGVVVASI